MASIRGFSRRHRSIAFVSAFIAFSGSAVSLAHVDEPATNVAAAKAPSSGQKNAQSRIDAYIRVLGFDAEQGAVARDLHQAMTAELARQSKKTRDFFAEAAEDRKAGDHARADKRMDDAIRTQRAATKKATQQFLDDLKALLRSEQLGNWQAFEQYRRRELYLRGGSVGGSGVDLFRIVEQLKLNGEPAAKANQLLAEYAPDIDRALKDREKAMADDEDASGGVQRFDGKSLRAMFDRNLAIDLRVREINQKHLRSLASVLPADLVKQLEEQYQLKAYRQAYRKTTLDQTLRNAAAVEGLTSEQKRKLEALAARHASESRAAGNRLAKALKAAEDSGRFISDTMAVVGPGGGFSSQKDPEDVREARAARRDLDRSTREELATILTPDQLAAIPKPNPGSGVGQRIEVHSNGADEMVFVSDMDEEDLPPMELGGGVMVRTVEVRAGSPTTPPDSGKSGEQPVKKD